MPINQLKRISACCVCLATLAYTQAATAQDDLDENETITVSGRVVDPEGHPVPAIARAISSYRGEVGTVSTQCDDDGQFTLEFRLADIQVRSDKADWRYGNIVATHDGFGPAFIPLHSIRDEKNGKNLTLRLVEDVPIQGQILDMYGKPVKDANLKVFSFYRLDSDNVDGFLKQYRDRDSSRLGRWAREHGENIPALGVLQGTGVEDGRVIVGTNGEGRFQLSGVGKERAVYAEISGPTIVSELVYIVTRPEIAAKWKRRQQPDDEVVAFISNVYPANFTHIGKPTTFLTGTVVSRGTGQPVAGASVVAEAEGALAAGTTDGKGRYRVDGLPTQGNLSVKVTGPAGDSYIPTSRPSGEYSAAAPLQEMNFKLDRGIDIRGRVTDADTGHGVRDAWVVYLPIRGNEFAERMETSPSLSESRSEADGSFQVVGMPGLGLVVAQIPSPGYVRASFEGLDLPYLDERQRSVSTITLGYITADQFHAVRRISPDSGMRALKIDLGVKQGSRLSGTLVDKEGNPVDGVLAAGLTAPHVRAKTDRDFTVVALGPKETRWLAFYNDEKNLGALTRVSPSTESPFTVTMRRQGIVSGRIVGPSGGPLPNTSIVFRAHGADAGSKADRSSHFTLYSGHSDADGRFRITNAIPGIKLEIVAIQTIPKTDPPVTKMTRLSTVELRDGETRDLGDLVVGG